MDNSERNPVEFLEWYRTKIKGVYAISTEKEMELFEQFEKKVEEMKTEKEETRTIISAITLTNTEFSLIPDIIMWEVKVQKRSKFFIWKFWETVEILFRSFDRDEVDKYVIDNNINLFDTTLKIE